MAPTLPSSTPASSLPITVVYLWEPFIIQPANNNNHQQVDIVENRITEFEKRLNPEKKIRSV